jgi:hypothetical protein
MSVKLDDTITPIVSLDFTIKVIWNWPLVALKELPNLYAIVDNKFWFDFDKYAIFKNPEEDLKDEFQMYFRSKDSKPPTVPYFIKNYTNGTLYGLGSNADINTFVFECVGVDDAKWETVIEFQLTIKRKTLRINSLSYSLLLQMLSLLEHGLQHMPLLQKRILLAWLGVQRFLPYRYLCS